MDGLQIVPSTDNDLDGLAVLNKQLIEDEGHDNPMNVEQLKQRMMGFIHSEYRAYFMAIEDKCGALTAAIMVLGRLFVEDRAHESTRIKDLIKELFEEYRKEMGSIDCAPLKEMHRTEELKCRNVIINAAEALDRIVKRELSL